MHENANITFNRAESSTLMSSILALQPREGGGGGGKSSDEIVIDVIDDAEERMPALLDAVWKSTGASGARGAPASPRRRADIMNLISTQVG